MKRFIHGLAALTVVIALLLGIPYALIVLAGNPLPSIDEINRVLTGPDYGGEFLIGTVLPIVGWIAWATMAIAILLEIPAQLRRVPAPRLPGLGAQQRGASVLVAAVIGMFGILTPVAANAADVPTSTEFTQSASVTSVAPAQESLPVTESPTYEVQDGDSLWAIAESQLGNGQRWNEIAQLNYGFEQADGWSLTAQHWLNAGWVLTLPADAASAPTVDVPVPDATQHVVEEGESLWTIAQDTLGDGNRFTEIFDANAGVPQTNGNQLTDPGSIDAGWVLKIPTAPATSPIEEAPVVATPAQEAPVAEQAPTEIPTAEDPATTAPDMSGLGIAPTSEAPAPSEAPVSNTVDQVDEADAGTDWIDEAFNLRTLGGIGAIAAAGILSILGIRRMKQRRQRRHGERIAMPAGEAATMELELRAVENPLGMESVDHALRYLATWTHTTHAALPPLYALRFADDEIALYLDAPSDLPEPFVAVTDDKMAWTIDPTQLPPLDVIPTAPWPALVSLGYDQGEAQLLVDLEHLGALNVTGAADVVDGALAALALELATTPWAQDLQITLVDVAPGLASAVDTGRVRHVDNVEDLLRGLRAQAASVQNALAELGVETIEEARSLGTFTDSWAPEIVFLGQLPDDATRAELADLVTRVPRVGIAAVAAGELVGEWTLQITDKDTAALSMPSEGDPLPLTPQCVSADELARALALLETTMESAHAVVEDWPTPANDEISITQDTPATQSTPEWADIVTGYHQPETAEPSDYDADADGVSAEDAAEYSEPAIAVEEAPEPVRAEAPSFDEHTPWVQLLGAVQLHNAQGQEPRTPQTSEINRSAVARATELIAFLALYPGATAVAVHDALWTGKDPSGKQAQSSRNGLASKARRWLGDSLSGEKFFPAVGANGYRLHESVRTDWHIWQELIGPNVSLTSTENLIAALRMVHGQPFAGVKEKYYGWAEVLRQEMIAAIGDAAHELVSRSLMSGRTAEARLAAAIGRQIDPVNERLWRDALHAEHQAGDVAGFERVVTQLEQHLDSFEDGYEAEPETQELITQARGQRPGTS